MRRLGHVRCACDRRRRTGRAVQQASGVADVGRAAPVAPAINSMARSSSRRKRAPPPLRSRCHLSAASASSAASGWTSTANRRHQRAASRRRTSAQGMVCTVRYRARPRRFTSVAHAASASSSTSVSRLSSNDPASAARASVGSASASFRISAGSRFMVLILPAQALSDTRSSGPALASQSRTADAARGAATKGGGCRPNRSARVERALGARRGRNVHRPLQASD